MLYVYLITNLVNGKQYVGQTNDPKRRWGEHRAAVRLRKRMQMIHHAMIKHGIDNFSFEVVASCLDQDAANDAETAIVAQLRSLVPAGYNVCAGGNNAPKTDLQKRLMSIAMKGKHTSPATQFKPGHAVSPETRAKVSAAQTGRKSPNQHPFTSGQETEIVRSYTAGDSLRTIGSRFEVTKKVIRRVLRKHDIEIRNSYETQIGSKRSPEAVAKAAAGRRGLKYNRH